MRYIFLILMLFLVGCTNSISNDLGNEGILPKGGVNSRETNADEFMKEKAINLCIQSCENYKEDLSSGPCLDGDIINDWACDVAHSPRTETDNSVENQCGSYQEGISTHFVEVTPNCELILAE